MFERDLLAGQRILITGGGTGLGAGMAEGLLEAGADVVICSRRKAVCDEIAARWRTRFPDRRIDSHGLDIRDASAVAQLVDAIWAEGGLTGLINNAAGNFVAQTQDLSPRGFDAVANIVFHGTFYVTQAVGKRWIAEAKEGLWKAPRPMRSVVSIITTWVDTGAPFVVPSAMSKAGIDAMTKSLAIEWARYGIRLNAIGPGTIPTEGMSKRLDPAELVGAASAPRPPRPINRDGEMRELQNLTTFLMAPGRCDWLSGQSIMMDGANSLANGADFYNLLAWSDADWKTARQKSDAQNSKDRAGKI